MAEPWSRLRRAGRRAARRTDDLRLRDRSRGRGASSSPSTTSRRRRHYVLTPSTDRMFLQRAMAQAVAVASFCSLARLLYGALARTRRPLEAVHRTDLVGCAVLRRGLRRLRLRVGTADERADAYFAAGEASRRDEIRLGSGLFLDLPCAYWPTHGPETRPAYLGDTALPGVHPRRDLGPVHPYPNAGAARGQPRQLVPHHPARRSPRHRPPW